MKYIMFRYFILLCEFEMDLCLWENNNNKYSIYSLTHSLSLSLSLCIY
jgi:hypothetical protein